MSGRPLGADRLPAPRGSAEAARVRSTDMAGRDAPARYDRVTVALHWVLGLALLAELVFGFALDELAARGTPARAFWVNLHKSCGIVLGALVLCRLAWRLAHRAPPWPAATPAWSRHAAQIGHVALYACMVVLPLSGYLASNFSKYGVSFFGHPLPPWGPADPRVYAVLNGIHDATGWLFAMLVAGHAAAALWHAFVARDGSYDRIRLARRTPPGPSSPKERP